MADQASLVIVKPDAIQRGLTGAVLARIDALRLEIIGAKVTKVSKETAEAHYSNIRGKPFFDETVDFLQGKLHGVAGVLALVYWGEDAVERLRRLTGATHPEKADPSTIRGAFGRMHTTGLMENVLHASADPADAEREIRLWFQPSELVRDIFSASSRQTAAR